MKFKELDVVVLDRDLPEHRLLKGDVGTIVHCYGQDGLELEFVRGSGRTEACLTLAIEDVRPIGDQDLIAVRRREPSS